jgi:hypothetical protein
VLGTVVLARPTQAQSGATAATPPARASNPFAPDNVKRVPVSKAVFGDAGIIVNARDDGFIEVAAAGTQKPILLQLRTLAARAWVDSTLRMLRAKPRRSAPPRTFRSDIAEYGTNGTMALTRNVTAGESEYSLYFSDGPTSSFTVPIEGSEADVFVAIVRKAVVQSAKMLEKTDTTAAAAALADSAARADSIAAAKKKKRPAAKRPASPPATAPADTSAKPKPATPNPAPVKPAPVKPAPVKPAPVKPSAA